VFLVNSRLGQVTAASSSSGSKFLHSSEASLLPKLRDHFAEFLNEGSLDHLSMLYLPTCVGFGTGTFPLPRGFSWRLGINDSPARSRLTSPLGLNGPRIFLRSVLPVCPRTTNAVVRLPFPVPPSVKRERRGTGISTCWPSPTPVGLGLGPD
jgi:hypothetical protein